MEKFTKEWNGFTPGDWCNNINVSEFIKLNYTPYAGDESFLAPPTERTKRVMSALNEKLKEERDNGGVISIDPNTVSSLVNYPAAYLLREDELIVGLQTSAPLERGVNPFCGIRMARSACKAYGYELSPKVEEQFTYRTPTTTVFSVYIPMKCVPHVTAHCSQDFPIPTAEAVSSATTAAWHSTALTA